MKYLIFFLSFSVQADAYLDFGVEAHNKTKDSFWQKDGIPINNPIGSVELGYEFDKGRSIFIRHASSVQQEDSGLNTIGIKVRIFGGDK